jgi:addiction module RelB/DinJ family antitoxin
MSTITKRKTKLIQTRLDEDLVNQATEVLDEIGLGMSEAIKVFLKKVAKTRGIPFSLTAPKAKYFSPDEEKQIEMSLDDIEAGRVYSFENQEEMDKFLDKL